MERRVVAVFGPGQPLKPRARTISSDAPEVHGDGLIDHL
jgi:hypothetical protein